MGNQKAKFKINKSWDSPELLDYDILGYHKKRTIIKGELTCVEYYKHYNGVDYSDLVVKEERAYTRNDIGLVQYRILTITWYLEDNTIGYIKSHKKFYSSSESIDEGLTRRGNIINDAKVYILSLTGQSYGFDFMTSLKSQIELYTQGYKQPLYDAILSSTKPYLTEQIKNNLIDILTF